MTITVHGGQYGVDDDYYYYYHVTDCHCYQ